MASGLIDQLGEALAATATDLDERGHVVEPDLEKAFHSRLIDQELAAVRQFRLDLDGWQGRLGPVDIGITKAAPDTDETVAPTLLELKWGDLPACSWDVLKLATALAEGKASRAFLIAGASQARWAGNDRGAELFAADTWEIDRLFDSFAADFAVWRTEVINRPTRCAASWGIDDLEGRLTQRLTSAGAAHKIKVVEIKVVDAETKRVIYAPKAI